MSRVQQARSQRSGDEVVLLSLFDGVGGSMRALDMLELPVALFASAETDERACRTVRYTWPDAVELGDVRLIDEATIKSLKMKAP